MSTSSSSMQSHKKSMRVYLSGGMEYADNEGRDWRSSLQDWLERELRCSVFNPNVESERFFSAHHPGVDFRALKTQDLNAYRDIVSSLVDIDCREIAERSDFVVCYWDASAMRGAGTKGELTMARFCGKPAYIVTSMPHEEIPGWVLGCASELFATFERLQRYLLEQYGNGATERGGSGRR